MSSFQRAALLLTLAGAAGCSSENLAREAFAKDRSCPLDSVTAKKRPDLSAYDLTTTFKPTPPPDIAADPARLRLWQAEQDKSKKQGDQATIVEVSGCKEKALYRCSPTTKKALDCSTISAKVP